jgi:uncharacterized protein YdeI (YjbR/CyaY-like superfamily)
MIIGILDDIRLSFIDSPAFRKWLQKNHGCGHGIWIEYYKDGRPGITYQDSLEEALCFGWIDSTIRRVDDAVYLRKFVKRRADSVWSVRNRRITAGLVRAGRITEWGLKAIAAAKQNGQWARSRREETTPPDVEGLRKKMTDKAMLARFDKLGPKRKGMLAGYYFEAKKQETRRARLLRICELMTGKRQLL